jgi:simple sugar transport system permease protein
MKKQFLGIKKYFSHELIVALILVMMITVITLINPAFLSMSNLFDLLKSSVVMGIMAIGVLIVLISGGIDISFTAIAAFSMYLTSRLLMGSSFEGSWEIILVLSGLTGVTLGLFNAVFISFFRLPTLIVTLGTASIFRGFLLAFVGTSVITNLPQGMIRLSRMTLMDQVLPSGEHIGLSVTVFFLLALGILSWLLLKYTLMGRGIYALGGAPDAAKRVGFNINRLQFFIYGLVGFLSGIAGIIHATMMRNANPFDLVGMELLVIAAVVLGGASITGGRGSVIGTILAVFILVIINNSLILLGISTTWQRVVVGLIIIGSTAVSARRLH